MHTPPSAKVDLEVKPSERNKTHMAWSYPLTFNSKEAFCTCVASPVSYTQTGLLPYSLEMLTGDKDFLFALFPLSLPFERANRGLVVSSSTAAHLSLASGNAKRRLAG